MKIFIQFIIMSVLTVSSTLIWAQNKPKISIQGIMRNASGDPINDGSRTVEFKLYHVADLGTALWTETVPDLQISGGVYSHLLGSITDLDASVFGQTVYLGVTVGSEELRPRTELTYAPYTFSSNTVISANYVRCSGAVGDVKYSILNPTQFALENGACWVPMDGSSMAGTALAALMQTSTLPDASGLFIRSHPYSGNNDPDRNSNSPIATVQSHSFLQHGHIATLSTDTHNHNSNNERIGNFGTGGPFTAHCNPCGPIVQQHQQKTTSSVPNHVHTVTLNNIGGAETRPKNRNFYVYIRVN
jgi:hypothetical protein